MADLAIETFIGQVLALPRVPRRPRPPRVDLAEAIAWVGGVELGAVRELLAPLPVSLDECAEASITPGILERLYEEVGWRDGSSPRTSRKAQGSFHTPRQIVDAMVTDALDAFLEEQMDPRAALDGVRIVDPSVGPGAFLAGALQAVRTRRAQYGLPVSLPAGTLCGVDISPLALEVCRLRLALAGELHPDLRVGDSLVDGPDFCWKEAWPRGFDVVLGNPPYLRDSQKKSLDAEALRRGYRAATSHYDLYVLFMERALQIARAGGVVCLLTSNRWLAQKYGRGIRGLLLEHRLRGVIDLRFRTFDDAAVQTSITLVQKQSPSEEGRTVLAVVDDLSGMGSLLDVTRPSVKQADLDSGPFRFHVQKADHALGERLRAQSVPLVEMAFVTLGMVFHDPRPGGRRKADFLSPSRDSRHGSPLLDGGHVDRWVANGGLWLDYCPAEHREPRFAELFVATKVLCRRIIGNAAIKGMVDEEGRWFSDNVVGVVPYHAIAGAQSRTVRLVCTEQRVARSRGVDVHYLAAVLNSRLVNWYYQTFQGFGMHLYPEHLKQMPIVVAPVEVQHELAAKAREAAALTSRQAEPGGCERLARVEASIDTLVEFVYGLTPAERTLLEGWPGAVHRGARVRTSLRGHDAGGHGCGVMEGSGMGDG